jgi:hypothetical protein
MIENHPIDAARDAGLNSESAAAAALGVAKWLRLAATPTFAIMAFLTAVHGGSVPDILCSAARDGSPLTGMVPMYLLMSAFHLSPWLRLLSETNSANF